MYILKIYIIQSKLTLRSRIIIIIIIIIGCLGPGKIKASPSLMKRKNDDNYDIIDKIYLCFKDPNEVKYQYLIRKRKKSHLDYCKNLKTFIEYSTRMQDASYLMI